MGLVSKRRGHWAGLLRLQRSSTSLNSDGVIGLYDFDGGGADICITGVPASSNSDRQSEYAPLTVFNRPCCKVVETMPGQCIPGETPCSLRGIYLFYDDFHPTEIANRMATNRAYNALLLSDAYPMDIRHLVMKNNIVHEYCWYYPTTKLGNLSFLVSLDLSYNNFHGELPPEFSHLRRLRDIDLSYNNFTGEIPIGIATLPSLKALSLGSNELLNGSNALSIFNVSTLEYLDLSNVGLTGDLPSDLGRHTPGLQALGLESNMLSGRIPRTISECSKLQILWLNQNNFVGAIPRELGTIPDEIGYLYNLKRLFIGKNELTGSIPLTIFNISSLGWLVMNDNKLEGSLPREIGNLTVLQLLHLSDNDLTGMEEYLIHVILETFFLKKPIKESVIPYEVGNLKFTDIAFSRNNFSGSIPIGHGLPNLIEILLSGNYINGILLASISNLSKLESLELDGNELAGSIPESLGDLRQLESHNLHSNSFTSDLSLITPLANSKNLRRLILSFNPPNTMLPKSIGNLSSLELFRAAGCKLKGHLPNEVWNLRNLSILDLDGNDSTGIVPAIISSLENLQRLSLGKNRISGPFPIVLCELPKLGMLSLSQNQMWGNIPSSTATIPSSLWNLKDILKMNLIVFQFLQWFSTVRNWKPQGCNTSGFF
ncbi:putative LRR receptor-like serine/threonine-protein kinase-like [Capsicum annuum]|nr:putative LRR receptor-like serine/threonine-protein kinase-like [Capsicum annuum]